MIAFCRIRQAATGAIWVFPIMAFKSTGDQYRLALHMEGTSLHTMIVRFPCAGYSVALVREDAPEGVLAEVLREPRQT